MEDLQAAGKVQVGKGTFADILSCLYMVYYAWIQTRELSGGYAPKLRHTRIVEKVSRGPLLLLGARSTPSTRETCSTDAGRQKSSYVHRSRHYCWAWDVEMYYYSPRTFVILRS